MYFPWFYCYVLVRSGHVHCMGCLKTTWRLTNSFQTKHLPVGEFKRNLEIRGWQDLNYNWISPAMVMENPEKYQYHAKRIREANLSYPILVSKAADGYLVHDGDHRIAKAKILGKQTIDCKLLGFHWDFSQAVPCIGIHEEKN